MTWKKSARALFGLPLNRQSISAQQLGPFTTSKIGLWGCTSNLSKSHIVMLQYDWGPWLRCLGWARRERRTGPQPLIGTQTQSNILTKNHSLHFITETVSFKTRSFNRNSGFQFQSLGSDNLTSFHQIVYSSRLVGQDQDPGLSKTWRLRIETGGKNLAKIILLVFFLNKIKAGKCSIVLQFFDCEMSWTYE